MVNGNESGSRPARQRLAAHRFQKWSRLPTSHGPFGPKNRVRSGRAALLRERINRGAAPPEFQCLRPRTSRIGVLADRGPGRSGSWLIRVLVDQGTGQGAERGWQGAERGWQGAERGWQGAEPGWQGAERGWQGAERGWQGASQDGKAGTGRSSQALRHRGIALVKKGSCHRGFAQLNGLQRIICRIRTIKEPLTPL